MQRNKKQRALVVGAGNFGTCLAEHLASLGHAVTLLCRSEEIASAIRTTHRNPRYLKELALSKHLDAVATLTARDLATYEVLVLAVPTQALREVLMGLARSAEPLADNQLVVCAAKGIEVASEKLPSAIVADVCGERRARAMVVLSGPSFAVEIAEGQPTAVSVASYAPERAAWAQELFHAPHFRVYTSADPLGLEVAGAMKNIFAIATGACAGLGFQANARAALMTRGLAEMTRVGVALGADPLTFNGLGGVGDLFLTCSSEKSRNYTVGYRLGRGEELAHVLASVGSVAEGVTTARSAYSLCSRLQVSAPITTAVYEVLYGAKPIQQAVAELMSRDARPEQG